MCDEMCMYVDMRFHVSYRTCDCVCLFIFSFCRIWGRIVDVLVWGVAMHVKVDGCPAVATRWWATHGRHQPNPFQTN